MIHPHRLSAAAFMLVVSVALVGCGSTAATPTSATPTSAPTPTPAAATPTPPEASATPEATSSASVQDEVEIEGFAFSPASITVPVGTTVTWTNKESAPHTIVSDDGTTFTSANLGNGETFSFTFTAAGTFAYHCGLHPAMLGKVIVTS